MMSTFPHPLSRSHCSCDAEFLNCLKKASKYDELADVVGNLFFNIIRPQCLANDTPPTNSPSPSTGGSPRSGLQLGGQTPSSPTGGMVCVATDQHKNCRSWKKMAGVAEIKLKVVDPDFTYLN